MTGQTNSLPKRHCMVVHAFYPLAETRVQRQAEALVDHGYEVDVICLRLAADAPEECHRGVQVYHLPVKQVRGKKGSLNQFLNYLHFSILAAIKLTRLHWRRPYHSVQVHNLPDFLVFCALILKLSGVPVILDLHDLMPEFYAARTGKGMTHWLTRLVAWQERLSCRFADHVITVTELWRRTLIERGVPAAKVSVVMNVADEEVFRRDAVAPSPQSNGHFRLFYHGTQVQRYGIDLILRAVDQLRAQIPELLLTVHGRGDYHAVLRQLADELNLEGWVQFNTDYVPLPDLPKLICAADVAVVPYRRDIFTDGILPTKLMEYVALGVPVIAARTPAIEAYFDETMVEFFTPGNVDELAACILRLYQDRARRATLAQNGSEFSELYSWTKQSADYVALIERLTTPQSI
jgi:glycosyltransferase involved in cell wall biosynthesis